MRLARWIGIVVVIAIIAAVFLWPKPEPSYQGRTLSSWLRQATEPARHTNAVVEARAAIRAIGPDRTVPVLLRLLKSNRKQTTLHDLLLDVGREFNVVTGPIWQSNDSSDMAAAGFEALGTNAVAAIPTLSQLANTPQHGTIALRCLAAIGPPARATVFQAFASPDGKTRSAAVWSVPQVVTNSGEIIVAVTNLLSDGETEVRDAAIHVIGNQTKSPQQALPLLLHIIQSGNTNDAPTAAMQIQNFGTNALVGFDTMSNAVHEAPYSFTALSCLRSMMVISPQRTLPILSNQLHSVDPGMRSRALMLLVREYPKPDDVTAAVEYAAQDPEEFIATRAERFLERTKGQSSLPK
jgi:hypothetical protein